mgnify:CR=1 FL=1
MKKKIDEMEDDLLPEYDFTGAVRGVYAEAYKKGTNIVVIDPDVLDVFPNAEAVNRALRSLKEIIKNSKQPAETVR